MLKRHGGPDDFSLVATTARATQLDLLHYVIETQRMVNVLPAAGTDRAIGIVLERVQTVTNADGAVVEVLEGNVLVHRAVNGLRTDPEGSRTSADAGLSGLCVRVGMPLLCRDTDGDPRVDAHTCRRAGVRSVAVAPMFRTGEALGVLRVMSGEAEHFDDADADVLELMANVLASALCTTSKLEREAGAPCATR